MILALAQALTLIAILSMIVISARCVWIIKETRK